MYELLKMDTCRIHASGDRASRGLLVLLIERPTWNSNLKWTLEVYDKVYIVLLTETPSLVQKSSDKFQIKNTETNEYLDIENAASANLLWRIDKIGEYFTRGYPLQWKKIKHSTYRFMFQESISGKYLKSDDNIPNPILSGMYTYSWNPNEAYLTHPNVVPVRLFFGKQNSSRYEIFYHSYQQESSRYFYRHTYQDTFR